MDRVVVTLWGGEVLQQSHIVKYWLLNSEVSKMWIYIAHIVLTEQDCFEELFETGNITPDLLSLSDSEFQTIIPTTGKAWQPYLLSW